MSIQGKKTNYLDLFTTQYIPYLLGTVAKDICSGMEHLWNNIAMTTPGNKYVSWYNNQMSQENDYIIPISSNKTTENVGNVGTAPTDYVKKLFYEGFDLFRYHTGFYMLDPKKGTATPAQPSAPIGFIFSGLGLGASSYWLNKQITFEALDVVDGLVQTPFNISYGGVSEDQVNDPLGPRKKELFNLLFNKSTVSQFLNLEEIEYYSDLNVNSCKGYIPLEVYDLWLGDVLESPKSLAFRFWVLNYLFNNELIGDASYGLRKHTGAIWASHQYCDPTTNNIGLKDSFEWPDEEEYSSWPLDFKKGAVAWPISNDWLSSNPSYAFTQFTPQKMGFNLDIVGNKDIVVPKYLDHHFEWFEPYNSKKAFSEAANNLSNYSGFYYDIKPLFQSCSKDFSKAASDLSLLWANHKSATGATDDLAFELFLPNANIMYEETQIETPSIDVKGTELVHTTLNGRIEMHFLRTALSVFSNQDADVSGLNYFDEWSEKFLTNKDDIFADDDFLNSVKKNKRILISPEIMRHYHDIDTFKGAFPYCVEFEIKTHPGHDFSNALADTGLMPFFMMRTHHLFDMANIIPYANKSEFEGSNPTPNMFDNTSEVLSLPFSKYSGGNIVPQNYNDFWVPSYNVDHFITLLSEEKTLKTNALGSSSKSLSETYFYLTSGAEDTDESYKAILENPLNADMDNFCAIAKNLGVPSYKASNENKSSYGRNFNDICQGIPAYSEVVFYEIEKFVVIGGQEKHIQTFILPNVSDVNDTSAQPEDAGVVRFIDSQVLPGTDYSYKISAYNYVLGSVYSYEIKGKSTATATPTAETISEGEQLDGSSNMWADTEVDGGSEVFDSDINFKSETKDNDNGSNSYGLGGLTINVGNQTAVEADESAHVKLHVNTFPSHKLFKIPIASTTSPIRVKNYPPITPQVDIVPYRGKANKIYIALNSSTDDYYAWPQGLTQEEQGVIYTDAQYSEDVDIQSYAAAALAATFTGAELSSQYALGPAKVRFKSDCDDYAYEIYRISEEDMPYGPKNYFDFGDSSISKKTTLIRRQRTTFIDKVKPNVNYYYVFRTIDTPASTADHRGWSNPTDIYRIKLIKNRENVFLDMEVKPKEYFKTQTRIKDHIPTKPFKKFLMIRPSLEQSALNENVETGGIDYFSDEVYSSIKNYFLGPKGTAIESFPATDFIKPLGVNNVSIWGQGFTTAGVPENGGRFRIRIKSKHTGKKVDIILGVKQPMIIDKTDPTDVDFHPATLEYDKSGTEVNEGNTNLGSLTVQWSSDE